MDTNVKCLECGKEFPADKNLHLHLKSHDGMERYYYKHFPRYDRLTGDLIKFEDKAQYFAADFNSPENFIEWVKNRPPRIEVQEYIDKILVRRKTEKQLVYSLSQVELKSLNLPGIKYLNALFDGYYAHCESLGFKPRWTKDRFTKPARNLDGYYVLCDTREQKPLNFTMNVVPMGMKFGDYKLNDDRISHSCAIERKAVSDFCGTLNDENIERFKREITRSHESGAYLVVVVEGDLEDVRRHMRNFYPNKPHPDGKKRPSYSLIMHNMRALLHEFSNLQFLFVKNRIESVRAIERIFASDGEYKELDLQLAYDIGEL
jgi:hypothetical protein